MGKQNMVSIVSTPAQAHIGITHKKRVDVRLLSLRKLEKNLWFIGGVFGPEAGIIGLMTMLLGISLIYLWGRKN